MTERKLRIFEVVKSTAGVGQYARWLVNGLHERFELTVACVSEGGPELAADLSRLPGVRALPLEMERYRVDPTGDARLALKLRQLIRGGGFDLVHAHASKPGLLARLAAAGSGVPVIYRPACFAFHDAVEPRRARAVAAVERVAARHLTAAIQCVCDEEADLARRWRVGSEAQLVTIHTGIDPAPFDAPADRAGLRAALGVPAAAPLVGSVGRLNPQKAPLDFVRAAARVHAMHPETHFVWVGSGPLADDARDLVARAGLGGVFHFAGERRDIPALLQALDVFVLPSHWEGFSLSVLEAMAARLPVVATRVMGTAEAVAHGESGLLVPSGAPEALAGAITALVADPQTAARYGRAGRRRIEQLFTRERMLAQIAALYERIARRPAPQERARPAQSSADR